MEGSLDTTNVWLAILAVAVSVQTLLLVGGAIALFRAYRTTADAIERIEQRHVAPLAARVATVADEIQDVTARVRHLDDAVRAKVRHLDDVAHVAGRAVAQRAWPIVGAVKAVSAGLRAFTSPASSTPVTEPARVPRPSTF
jgi:hypothetical protein